MHWAAADEEAISPRSYNVTSASDGEKPPTEPNRVFFQKYPKRACVPRGVPIQAPVPRDVVEPNSRFNQKNACAITGFV
jgi:hypothetical protein